MGSGLSLLHMSHHGLRWKFNLFLLPVVAATVVLLGWLDSRHERVALQAAHGLHAPAVAVETAMPPLESATSPDAVARRSIVMHVLYAAGLLILIGVVLNAALSRFVLTPLGFIRDGIEKMERGHWRLTLHAGTEDEVGRVVDSFQLLGLKVDAIVLQLLRAERLATLALVAKKTTAQIEPRVQRIVAAVGDLQRLPDANARTAAQTIAVATAEIVGSIRGLDQLFEASLHLTDARRNPQPERHLADGRRVEAASTGVPVDCGAGSP